MARLECTIRFALKSAYFLAGVGRFAPLLAVILVFDIYVLYISCLLGQDALSAFAARHSAAIRADAVFRAQFHEMCAKAGVDPLASTRGSWASKLGLGAFYAEIAVTAAEAMIVTKPINGGLMPFAELMRYIRRRRGVHADPVSEDDCRRAIAKLAALGGSGGSSASKSLSSPPGVYEIVRIAGKEFVRSVPMELNNDQNDILALAEKNGGSVTIKGLKEQLQWADGQTQ